MVLALMKYYLDDRQVLGQAIRFIDRLLTSSNPVTAQKYMEQYLQDPASLLLLLVTIEKFEVEDLTIVIYSTAIVTKCLRCGQCDDMLRKNRPTFILRSLNEILDKASVSGGCHFSKEEMLAIARVVEDLYYSSAIAILPQSSYHYGSAEVLERNSLRGSMVLQLNEHVVVPLLMAQVTIHAEDPVMVTPLLRALGNMLFLRHDLKKKAMAAHFSREIMRILKFYQSVLKVGDRERRGRAVEALVEALLTLSNSIDLAGPSEGHIFTASR